MSASQEQRAEWLDARFWDRLDRLESRHLRIRNEHAVVRRGLERVSAQEADELRKAWRRYCEVIAELDQTTAEIEVLRTCPG